MRNMVRTNIVTQTTVKYRNRTTKTICAFVSFIAVLLALTCPSFQRRATAQDQMDDDMDMRWFFRPIGMVGALVDDGFVPNPYADKAYTSIDYPGAVLTSAFGINNKGNIVGFFQDASKNSHGFFYNRVTSSFASIDYPNPVCTTGTDARGINKRGDIIGACTDNANNFYGYVLTADGFSPVQAPGHLSTIPQGISPDGRIVGCVHDTNSTTTMFGMSLDSGGFNFFGGKFGGLDGNGFMNNGVTKGGRIVVGWFTDTSVSPSRARAYIVRRGVAMAFDYPNAALTQAWDVSAEGDVVGVYRDADGRIHGFLRSADAEFASIDFPGATLTRAFGINSNGDIVGTYVASGVQHAFVRSAKGRGNQ
ncbi:MAG TPA: hypothetical protein VGL29_05250 [Blastocatellia bacterium]